MNWSQSSPIKTKVQMLLADFLFLMALKMLWRAKLKANKHLYPSMLLELQSNRIKVLNLQEDHLTLNSLAVLKRLRA